MKNFFISALALFACINLFGNGYFSAERKYNVNGFEEKLNSFLYNFPISEESAKLFVSKNPKSENADYLPSGKAERFAGQKNASEKN